VVGVAHLSKSGSADLLARVIGSVGFVSTARSLLGVGEHPENPRDRVLVTRKANLANAPDVPALRFRVEAAQVDHPDGGDPIRTARVVVLGEEHGIDPDSILAVPSPEERGEREDAEEFLRVMLAGGPRPAKEVKRAAQAEGIAERTLQRARDALGVKVERRGWPATSTWALPDDHGECSSTVVPTPVAQLGDAATWHNCRTLENKGLPGDEDREIPQLCHTSACGTTDEAGTTDDHGAWQPPEPEPVADDAAWLRAELAALDPSDPDHGLKVAQLRREAVRRRRARVASTREVPRC
jgi:hypothetical protein